MVRLNPFEVSLTVTCALGRTAPEESRTVPVMEPAVCAKTAAGRHNSNNETQASLESDRINITSSGDFSGQRVRTGATKLFHRTVTLGLLKAFNRASSQNFSAPRIQPPEGCSFSRLTPTSACGPTEYGRSFARAIPISVVSANTPLPPTRPYERGNYLNDFVESRTINSGIIF